MKRLLLVTHAPSDNTRRLAEAVARGARHPEIEGVELVVKTPFEADADDVLAADALILGTPENFGYMSGALKDFFDRIFYPCLAHTEARPYALYVRAGSDGTGTCTAVERIANGLKWRAVQPPRVLRGAFQEAFIEQCETLGTVLAAGLEAGIF